MQSCAPAVCKPGSDRSAYCAVIADACEFNRGLSRDRASRLPFLDLATQTAQKPAPWLYRNPSDISKGLESHTYARYTRHRWVLNQIAPAKRRKLAADRLWYNLQNGLGALGVPAELIPSVTQRAFTLANLPIPASLASQLESSGVAKPSVASLTTPNSVTMSSMPNGTRSHSICLTSTMTRRSTDSCPEQASRKPSVVDPVDATEDTVRVTKLLSTDTLSQSTRMIEDGVQSTDISGQRADVTEDVNFVDPKLEDEITMNENKLGLVVGETQPVKSYEMDEDSEEADDALVDGGEDEEDEEEELDDDDDVEWVQPRGKRSYSACGSANKTFSSRRQRRRTIQSRKGSRFSSPASRLSERRVIRGRSFAMGSQDKVKQNLRSSDSTEMSMVDSLGPRRSGRAHVTAKTKMTSAIRTSKDKDSLLEDRWPSYSEPGFQPNSGFLPAVDRTYADSGDLDDPLIRPAYPADSTMISTNKDALTTLRDHTKSSSSSIQPVSDVQDFSPQSASQTVTSSSTCNRLLPDVPPQMPSMPPASFAYPATSRTTMAQLLASVNSNLPPADMATADTGGTSLEYAPSSTIQPGRLYCAANETADCNSAMFSPRTPAISQSSIRHPLGVPRDPPEHHTGTTTNRNTQDFATISRYAVNRENSTPVTANLESFATPQVATTTVTFFVCEVCASRYRSTAGLRYHYHSQHSGYTPKNPISASASRLVVPIGEERGIGGGLRGGRPRRHKDASVRGLPAATIGDTANSSFASSYTTGNRPVISTRTGTRISSTTDFFCPSASLIDSAELKSNEVEHNRSMTPTSRTAEGLAELQRVQMSQRQMSSYSLDNAPIQLGFGHPHHASPRNAQTNWSSADTYHIPPSSQHHPPPQQQPTIYHPPPFRLTPHQRRLERQRCSDRVNPIGHLRHGTSTGSCCVYCLGDERMNPRLGRPEGLLRCARCGSLAHFACLHLPTHVIDNAMRYPWQCIECKTCWLCGSHEQENRMIFCGDCDRVFHVDCLPIPVSRLPPPTAHWSCDICLHDLYAMTDGGPNPGPGAERGADRAPTGTALVSTEPALYSGSS